MHQVIDCILHLPAIAGTAAHTDLNRAGTWSICPCCRHVRWPPSTTSSEGDRCRCRVSPPPQEHQPITSHPVDRIAIVGCGGSGKSHLARELGARSASPPFTSTPLYYDKDWKPLDKDSSPPCSGTWSAAPRWIIDGNYASTLPIRLEAADTVIFLDLPAWTCLWGIMQRRSARRRAAPGDRRLRPDHLELRPLHPRLPAQHGPAGPRADRRPRAGRRGDRAAQPPRRPPLPHRCHRRPAGRGTVRLTQEPWRSTAIARVAVKEARAIKPLPVDAIYVQDSSR